MEHDKKKQGGNRKKCRKKENINLNKLLPGSLNFI